ncbi:MAG: YIP1 family protein [Planctomycetes bacterium]|nr:YIP1 family protein [Planctomycetota bacterium]
MQETSSGLQPPSQDINQPSGTKPFMDDKGDFFRRLFNTWLEATFYPNRFFRAMPTNAGIGAPFVYALITGIIGVVFAVGWNIVMEMLNINAFGMSNQESNKILCDMFGVNLITLWFISLVISPLLITIGLFVGSGIWHLCLMILGGNKKGFEATFRSMCYAQGPMVFDIIPMCGGIIGGVWSIVLVIIGLKETHQIPVWKAIVAYLLPLVCVCCLAIVAAIVVPLLIVGIAK